MRCPVHAILTFAAAAFAAALVPQPALAADAPRDRVVVIYFHRVPGCATCQKMGAYSEEAIRSPFAKDLKDGKIEFHVVDFEDPKNAALAKGYKVSSPTLIVARIAGNKVAEYKNLTEIWSKAGDKAAFIDYVQTNIKQYQK